MSSALLVAEPERTSRAFLTRHLADDGFDVLDASAGAEVLDIAERARPDLVVLGDTPPDVSPLELCRRIRDGEPGRCWNRHVPVIVLGSDGADAVDRVRAFDRGADDFLARPFVYDELLARIRAILRRTRPHADERIQAGGLTVDLATRSVTVDGRRVDLAGKEFELLAKLAGDPTRVFTKETLLRDVWGFRSAARTRTLDSHASRLRRKLAIDADTPYVVNVWGVGYRLLEP